MAQSLMRLLLLASIIFFDTSLRASSSDSDEDVISPSTPKANTSEEGLAPIHPFQKNLCLPIVKTVNPLLLTLQESDQAQSNLTLPIKVGTIISRYQAIVLGQNAYAAENTHISVGLLKNGTKILTKKSKDIAGKRAYTLDIALNEVLAAKLGRALFDVPTMPPIEILYTETGEFEVRQYLLEWRTSRGEKLPDQGILWDKLCSEPAEYGRGRFFIAELALFDDLFAFSERRRTSYLFASARTSNPVQNKVFYSMDYEESFYDHRTGLLDPKKKGKRFIDHGDCRLDDFHENMETELNRMQDSEGITRSLGLYISLLPVSNLNLDLFIAMIYLLRESSIWEQEFLSRYSAVAKFTPVESIIADLVALTIIRTSEEDFTQRLKLLVGCGLSFTQFFRSAKGMLDYGDALKEFLENLPSIIDEKTVDIIIQCHTPKPFSLFDLPWAPLSAIRKLDYLVQQYPQFTAQLRTAGYKKAVNRDPTLYIDPEGPLGPFSLLAKTHWHNFFLNYYKGRTFDDGNHALQVCLYSNKVTQRLFETEQEEELTPMYSTHLQQSIISWQVALGSWLK